MTLTEFTSIPRSTTGVLPAQSCAYPAASQLLAKYPGLGRATDMAGVRVFPIVPFPYLIYYRVADDALEVVHVRHGRRDVSKPGELV
ncbi:type II toxin-antitoxin system RelE/ParE family toxin [Frankia sp. RB7]|nr:type II toxin-antitoxin system RelE/ParE family toxin [Frankia sp. RB7]